MKRHNFLVGLLTLGAFAFAGSFLAPAPALADPQKDKPADTNTDQDKSHKDNSDHGNKNNPDTNSDKAKDKDKDKSKDKDKEKDKKKDDKDSKKSVAKVGEPAPEFSLTDLDGKAHKLSDYKGKIVVLEWFNPSCPFIVKHHQTNLTFNNLYTEFKDKNVVFIAINSSAPGKEGSGKELNQKMAKEYDMEFPICLDEDGSVGKLFGAKTTPHCYVIDAEGKLAYSGAVDNNTDRKKLGDKNYVKQAVEQLIKGETVTESETKPYGCSVKYKS